MILAGDIGGTSTRLGLFELKDGRPEPRVVAKFPSRDHPGLEPILKQFLAANPVTVTSACFGIAGPVQRGRVQTQNLPWVIETAAVARELGGAKTWLINDLEANAFGVGMLNPAQLVELNPAPAADPEGNAAIISAGTGLGEAGFYHDGQKLHPFACEGGHATFAPVDELQAELLLWLQGQFGHVSVERVLSGPGLVHIHNFLRARGRTPADACLANPNSPDPAARISQCGLAGHCAPCREAVNLLIRIYGSEAGNLALKLKATRAVFIGGGIAPKLLPKLQEPAFREAFLDKGRMRVLLEPVPLRVILEDNAALGGAALCAALRSGAARHEWLQG